MPTFDLAPIVPETQVLINDSRQLNCLIKGKSIVFLVTVACNCAVSNLKEAIQRKQALDSLKDVGPHKLELWKVSAIDKSRCEVTWLTPTTGRH
jgi:hypothetical protein